jgi:hypothetical protein
MGDWGDLLPALTEADRRQVEAGLDDTDVRIQVVLRKTDTYHWTQRITILSEWAVVRSWPAEERRRAALVVYRRLARGGGLRLVDAVRDLAEGDVPWHRADLLWCLEAAARGCEWIDATQLEMPMTIAKRVPAAELTGLAPALSALLVELANDYSMTTDARRRTSALVATALDRSTGSRVPSWLLHDGDGFGPTVRAELGDLLTAPGVADLLAHCAALNGPTAPARWRRRLDEHLSAAPNGAEAVRAICEAFVAHGGYVHDDTDHLLRGLVWALSRDGDDRATDLLARVTAVAAAAPRGAAGYPYAQRTAIAAVRLLADRNGDAPVRTLTRLVVTAGKVVRRRVETALAHLGAARGWSPGEAPAATVDDHGLDPDGRRHEPLGPYEATVEIVGTKAGLRFARDGSPLKGVPARVRQEHRDELRQLRDQVKRIGTTLTAERRRVEGLLSEERTWAYPDWVLRYLDHPVTGAYGRRLLWETSHDGQRWSVGLPRRDASGWALVDRSGVALGGERVRLWHPVRAVVDEVLAWRAHLLAEGLPQPFKQAFREVYLLTPAEEGTASYSNRFAAHILRYQQVNALMRARGWEADYLGPWDGGHDGEATRVFGDVWRASFHYELVDAGDEARYCATDQVRFARRDGVNWQPASVTDVPVLVFTEAMRDVDLFVGVTSIATDPQWADRGADRFREYWHTSLDAALAPSAQVRRDALARLLPRLRIADRVRLSERHLHVRGNLREYRIHLGSSNIMVEPDNSYLCVVPARGQGHQLHLPFEDDPVLSTILSKAIMLADDDTITDPSVLRQLAR